MKKVLVLGLIVSSLIGMEEPEILRGNPSTNVNLSNSSFLLVQKREKYHSIKESLTDGFFEGLKMGAAQLTGLIFIASLKEGLPYAIKYFRGNKEDTGLEPGQKIALKTNLLMKLSEISEELKDCDESQKANLEFQIKKIQEILNQLG